MHITQREARQVLRYIRVDLKLVIVQITLSALDIPSIVYIKYVNAIIIKKPD